MTVPVLKPDAEAARLAALDSYGILDTEADPRFDGIVALARQICAAPIGMVSFVDADRQWFKAQSGLNASETSLEAAVCTHTVALGSLLVIPDMSLDERTRANAFVTGGPLLRFYAGAPILTADGAALGTVGVIDVAPRPGGLSTAQAAAMELLAEQAMALVELQHAMDLRDHAVTQADESNQESLYRAIASEARSEVLRDVETRTTAAHEAAHMGTFEFDLRSGTVRPSIAFCRLHGIPEAATYPAAVFEDLVYEAAPSQTPIWERLHSQSARADRLEYRIMRADDGAIRWLSRRGEFVRAGSGEAHRFVGAVQDVTDAKLAEQRQSALLALGDAARDATAVGEVIASVAAIVGETLHASRAGFAAIDREGDLFQVLKDWTSDDLPSVVGGYPIRLFRATVDRLEQAITLAVPDTEATGWLGREARRYAALGTRAAIVIPYRRSGKLLGALFVHAADPRVWTGEELDFAHAAADRLFAAVAKLQAEADHRVLNQELGHRLKNTLAMVQAVAKQTLREASDKEAVRAFNRRIVALATAHDVLLQQNWTAARIRSVAQGVLSLHGSAYRIDLHGPDLSLAPRAVLSLSMLLHELATNAIKYGSLSVDDGRVEVRWTVTYEPPEALLGITWIETGGPAAQAPTRQGFGSRLIRMGLSGTGHSELRFEPEGLVAEFRAPLSAVTTY